MRFRLIYRITNILLAILTIVIVSCKEEVRIEQIGTYDQSNRKYECSLINWMITIPDNWIITSIDTIRDQSERGLQMIKEQNLEQRDAKVKNQVTITHLISFDKGKNGFKAFLEPYTNDPEDFHKQNTLKKNFYCKSLEEQGLQVDTSWMTEQIGGREFSRINLTVYHPESKKIYNQIYYNGLIDGQIFTAIIGYNDQESSIEMLTAIKESKFEK